MKNHYFLFDIDGVLLKPGGYRKASNETLHHFFTQMGFKDLPDFDPFFVLFEAIDVTSEWDMLPLFLVAGLEKSFQNYNLKNQLMNWTEITAYVQNQNGLFFLPEDEIDYFASYLMDGISPAESVFKSSASAQFFNNFPRTSTYSPWVFADLLCNTRDPHTSEVTAFFQNLILGDRLFESILDKSALHKTESYLILHDQNNLGSAETKKILELCKTEEIYCAAMTARPSGYPDGCVNHQIYFPEAELGLRTAALEHIPVIGYGSMVYLAKCFGETGDFYLKPSPIHALSAVLASRGRSIRESVKIAYSILKDGEIAMVHRELLDGLFPKGSTIHIFEDSAIGIRSVTRLTKWLNSVGYEVDCKLYGISEDQHKISALKKENAAIYANINAALKKGLGGRFS